MVKLVIAIAGTLLLSNVAAAESEDDEFARRVKCLSECSKRRRCREKKSSEEENRCHKLCADSCEPPAPKGPARSMAGPGCSAVQLGG